MDVRVVLELLAGRGQSLATAESLTGGRLAVQVTGVPGASRVYRGGLVAYATDVKVGVLGVPAALVEQHGVVSAQCAGAMAAAARERFGATYAVATTGVAGPDEQEGKPPGTVFVGLAGPGDVTTAALELVGDRATVQERTCSEAITLLAGVLQREEPALG